MYRLAVIARTVHVIWRASVFKIDGGGDNKRRRIVTSNLVALTCPQPSLNIWHLPM